MGEGNSCLVSSARYRFRCFDIRRETMVWLPDWLHEKQKREREQYGIDKGKGTNKGKGKTSGKSSWSSSWSSDKGKGWGKNSWGSSKGKGKGKRGLDKNYAKRVWVGGLPEGLSWKPLQELMNTAGKTTWIEVFQGKSVGTAGVSYATEEEASHAVQTLNGATLEGVAIQVDVWEKQTK